MQEFNLQQFEFPKEHEALNVLLVELKALALKFKAVKDSGKEEMLAARASIEALKAENIGIFTKLGSALVQAVSDNSADAQTQFLHLLQTVAKTKPIMVKAQEDLLKLQETPVAVFKAAADDFNAALEKLVSTAEELQIPVPWQIRYCAERGDDGVVNFEGGRITDKDGKNIWEATCCILGHTIQDGAAGEGKIRYHCTEIPRIDICQEVYDILVSLKAAIQKNPSQEFQKMFVELHPHDGQFFSQEINIPVFLHLDVIEPPCLAERINLSFDKYQNRMCLGAPSTQVKDKENYFEYHGFCWKTFAQVGHDSRALGSFMLGAWRPKSFIGITGSNCVEFMVSDFACALSNNVSVGLHTTV